ncbi:MAG TPA: hypothetical protein VLG44_05370 [Chlamydiales bacterium]|nr:hypothetical protein [Chlamydiales bacterium]
MSVKSVSNWDKVKEFTENRSTNRCCALARITMGAVFTTLFSAKSTLFTVITALSRVNSNWYNSWKERTKRSYKATGYSMALSMQGIRQFLWYSTMHAPNASFKRDVERMGSSLGYELIGEDNWEKNPFRSSGGIPIKATCRAILGIYPKEDRDLADPQD